VARLPFLNTCLPYGNAQMSKSGDCTTGIYTRRKGPSGFRRRRDESIYTYESLIATSVSMWCHVCTNNASHASMTVAALEAGKHVMCEKPMARNAAEARTMVDAAKRTRRKLSISFQNRFSAKPSICMPCANRLSWARYTMAKRTPYGDGRFRRGIFPE